ncbi:MAG: hypothetical protein JSS20_08050, partial [Proteobacteria bacterium]|nr:hypothetical protein [Pseudomonadota bacterium]
GVSTANTGLMLAIASMQLAFGWIVGALTPQGLASPEIAYRAGFGLQAAMALLALVVYWPIKDVRPRG